MHVYYNNLISGENSYSKLSLIDLAGSEGQILEDDSGERVTELLHVMKSLSAYVILTIIFFLYCYHVFCLLTKHEKLHVMKLSFIGPPPHFWKSSWSESTLNAFTLNIADSFTLIKIE